MRALALLGIAVVGCGRIGFAREDAQLVDHADGPSPIVAVQVQTNSATGADNALTFPVAVQAGNTVVVCFTFDDGTAGLASVTDSLANTYAMAVGPVTTNGYVHYIAAADATASGSDAVTVTLSGDPGSEWALLAIEYAGLRQDPFDVGAYDSGTGTEMMTGSASTSSSHELLLAYAHSTDPQVGSDFTLRASAPDNLVEDQVVFAAGDYSASGATTNGIWTLLLATFAGRD